MRSPIRWFGGKNIHIKKILPNFPTHKVYVEVFGGSGALLFAKQQSPIEVYNDIDSGLVNFFRVLRDEKKFNEFQRYCELHPYSREEFMRFKKHWKDEPNDIERAYMWYVIARSSFSGDFNAGWSFSTQTVSRNMSSAVSNYISSVERLPECADRLKSVQVENYDFRKIFNIYDGKDTFFYVDPPYVQDTRSGGTYEYEIEDADHVELVNILLNFEGKAILSGYDTKLYQPLIDANWFKVEWDASCCVPTDNDEVETKRTEVIWLSPSCKDSGIWG